MLASLHMFKRAANSCGIFRGIIARHYFPALSPKKDCLLLPTALLV